VRALPAALVLGLAVVLLAAAAWLLVVQRGPAYDASLVRHDDDRGEANRYTDLADGEAQLAIGSPDGHRAVVQFRDPDGSGWTEPETVWEEPDETFIDTTLRYGGGTVATTLLYTADTGDEYDGDDTTIALVCPDGEVSCTARRLPTITSEPQVTPDGTAAWFDQDEDGTTVWTAEDGFLDLAWSGHPGYPAYGRPGERPSEPLLSPDGSLTVVAGRPSDRPGACDVRLLRAPRGTADLVEEAAATVDVRLTGRGGLAECDVRLATFSDDWLRVDPDAANSDPFWFVRAGGGWEVSREDPSGLMAGREVLVAGFVSWNDVAWSMPDGRTLQVQSHLLGEETWSDPVAVGEGLVPEGARCEDPYEGYEVGDGAFAIVVQCEEGAARGALVAASADLEEWEAEYVVARDPFAELAEEPDRLVVGPLVWTPGEGFSRR
jgi:hypothetical protein